MVQWEVPRAPASVLLLARLGAERGVPAGVCLRGTGLDWESLQDPGAEVSAEQELAVVRNLLDALGDPPGIGLEAGTRYHLTTYGIWGFALFSSPTLRSAAQVGLHHLDLTHALCRIRARERGGDLQLVLEAPDLPGPVRRFVVERDSAAIRTIQRELFSPQSEGPRSAVPVPLRAVDYDFPAPPGGTGRYEEVFGTVPSFGARENVLTVDAGILDRPLPQADAHTAALSLAQCRDLAARRRARTGLAGRVRSLLLADPAAPPDVERVAAALHLSGRTLRRRLADEGVSFRVLLGEVREQLAEELLAGGLPVAEVARRLGYAEVSSFSQAFRRWKGTGPRAYRARRTAAR